MTLSSLIRCARGEETLDLLLTNGRVINVFSGEIVQEDIGIVEGKFTGFGEYKARKVVDLKGRFVAPGFIDAHLHIESTMTCVSEFVRAILPHGTTTVIADPHEIANVAGIKGIQYMLYAAKDQPMNLYFTLPSCVPATHLETAGASLPAEDLSPLAGHPQVVGLGEMMNYPGVIHQDAQVLAKIDMMRRQGKPIDGHGPGLSGLDLNAYLMAGIGSDHECASLKEAREKLRSGMHIMIREGTGAKNLHDLLPLVTDRNAHQFMWCTDDRHAQDLLDQGHIDALVADAIRAGLDPVVAIQLATLYPARYFGLNHLGAIAPGRQADLVIFSDLHDPKVEDVYVNGIAVAAHGSLLPAVSLPDIQPMAPMMNVQMENIDFSIPKEDGRIRVIEVVPDQLVTHQRLLPPTIENSLAVADPGRDLLKIAVVERHHGTGNVGKGFVRGLGLRKGAIASSVAHDSHNIIVAGVNDEDMMIALTHVVQMGGGLVTVCDGKVLADLELPIAGLMSTRPLAEVRERLDRLIETARTLGAALHDPFMTLSFLALPVIPELKITDRGLIDVVQFEPVGLFVPEGRAHQENGNAGQFQN